MLLVDSGQTPYDLRFSLFGLPIRVHPAFWLMGLLLGMNLEPRLIPVWLGVVFVSVLVHELGHAATQRLFGQRPWIVLHGMGGYSATQRPEGTWTRSVLVSLAGPAAGFALAGVVFAILRGLGRPSSPQLDAALQFLLSINLFWSVLNLAPIWPLDGGRVARDVLVRFLRPATGIVASLWLSIVCAVAVGAWLWSATQSTWNLMLFALLGYQNYQALVAYQRSRGVW